MPRTLFDLKGGYLSYKSETYFNLRYTLLSSHNTKLFNIMVKENYEDLCTVMNKLQNKPFVINSRMLTLLTKDRDSFENAGLLVPRFLQYQDINGVAEIIRDCHRKNQVISKHWSYSDLLAMINKDIQRACYEQFILDLAEAYEGYQFYLPSFLDFRGRIYRCGINHFHERDLARSLILFAESGPDSDKPNLNPYIRRHLKISAAFHYKSFETYNDAYDWYYQHEIRLKKDILSYASKTPISVSFTDRLSTRGVPKYGTNYTGRIS